MDKCLNDDPTHTLYEWDLYLILLLSLIKEKLLSWRNQVGLTLGLLFFPMTTLTNLPVPTPSLHKGYHWLRSYSLCAHPPSLQLWGAHSTQNNHGPGDLGLKPWNPEQEVSDPETRWLQHQARASPGRLLPQDCGGVHPLDKYQAEDAAGVHGAVGTGSYYESAVAWMWLFCRAHPASC